MMNKNYFLLPVLLVGLNFWGLAENREPVVHISKSQLIANLMENKTGLIDLIHPEIAGYYEKSPHVLEALLPNINKEQIIFGLNQDDSFIEVPDAIPLHTFLLMVHLQEEWVSLDCDIFPVRIKLEAPGHRRHSTVFFAQTNDQFYTLVPKIDSRSFLLIEDFMQRVYSNIVFEGMFKAGVKFQPENFRMNNYSEVLGYLDRLLLTDWVQDSTEARMSTVEVIKWLRACK